MGQRVEKDLGEDEEMEGEAADLSTVLTFLAALSVTSFYAPIFSIMF